MEHVRSCSFPSALTTCGLLLPVLESNILVEQWRNRAEHGHKPPAWDTLKSFLVYKEIITFRPVDATKNLTTLTVVLKSQRQRILPCGCPGWHHRVRWQGTVAWKTHGVAWPPHPHASPAKYRRQSAVRPWSTSSPGTSSALGGHQSVSQPWATADTDTAAAAVSCCQSALCPQSTLHCSRCRGAGRNSSGVGALHDAGDKALSRQLHFE